MMLDVMGSYEGQFCAPTEAGNSPPATNRRKDCDIRICRCSTNETKQDINRQGRERRRRLMIVGAITPDCREGRTDLMNEAFLQMAGVFGQLELSMVRERVLSGLANAQAGGGSSLPVLFEDLAPPPGVLYNQKYL